MQTQPVQTHTVEPRIQNPGALFPDATAAVQALIKAIYQGGVSPQILELVHLRASQVNGCSFCVDSGYQGAKRHGETDERRLFAVAAWREAPYFTDAERAALALAECVTRLSDRPDPVPDAVWEEAARYYDDRELAALILWIATTNLFNRINVSTKQPAGVQSW